MAAPQHNGADSELSPEDNGRMIVTFPAEVLDSLRATCEAKAQVSLIGRLQGKHPGLKVLTAWARETLQPSFLMLTIKANNLFEITFTSPEGRIHALTQPDLNCESASITLSSWRPQFDAKKPKTEDTLDFPLWVQVADLCQVLRQEHILHIIGAQIGQVVAIDTSETYRTKLFGPRIRVLVRDINKLPHIVVLPRIDRKGTMDYLLEYSGLPNQCGRCRSRDHQVRHCPKKEV